MCARKYLVVSAILVVTVILALMAMAAYFHIMLPDSDIAVSDPDARAYVISKRYILLVWRGAPFMIYPKDKWVGHLSDYRNSLMGTPFWPQSSPLIFWPRGSYASVPLGDGVKRDKREQYEFIGNKIRIRSHFFSDEEFHEAVMEIHRE